MASATRTISVNSTTDLNRAIKNAVAGDTILVAPGNYGSVLVNSINRGPVVVKSANLYAEAVFDNLLVSRSSNFTFASIEVSHALNAGETEAYRMVRVQLSNDISFVDMYVHGTLNNNPNDDGIGFSSSSSSRIAMLDSRFTELNIAGGFGKGSDVIFAGNTISNVREGLNLAQVDGALVERNYITDIRPDFSRGDHADAIQVHAGGTALSSNDLTFRSNVIKVGNSAAHGFFINNEKGAQGLFNTNITVADNYYEGNARHGITIGYAQNVDVHGNTIRDVGTMGLAPAILINNVTNGEIHDNIAPLLLGQKSGGNTNVVWHDNIDVRDRLTGLGVDESTLFSSPVGSKDLDFSSLNARAGSVAAAKGIGFAAIDNIGDIKAAAAAVLAAYLPQLDHGLQHAVML